jgi:hypothetical protein
MKAVPPWQTPNAMGNGADDSRVGLAGVLTSMTRTPDGPMKNLVHIATTGQRRGCVSNRRRDRAAVRHGMHFESPVVEVSDEGIELLTGVGSAHGDRDRGRILAVA